MSEKREATRSVAFAHRPGRGLTDEWLTPPELLSRLGKFDLDPCAPVMRHWDTASHHYTKAEDGLFLQWHGRVWLNPPYSLIYPAMKRMAGHGRGIALVFARTETQWFFETVWESASAILFLRGRLHFHDASGQRAKGNAGGPHVLVAYGDEDCAVLQRNRDLGSFHWIETAES